jgi:hypothetical protein
MSESRYLRLIDALIAHDVRFVIVGGMAAVLQRAPILTSSANFTFSTPNWERVEWECVSHPRNFDVRERRAG